ncbi:hypothetical protein [Paenibacillus sp. sgz500958]|uniref:hypothetical protein n=1 Tax=Paenibacillus sp. sgz500958 TaxID=3242475 RepID=UPI0036D2E962
MVAQLIWIAAVYASAVILVQIFRIREESKQSPRTGKWMHYVLITRNHESVVEWYIRALGFHSFITGKQLRLTLVDDGSSDDTMMLVSIMKRSGYPVDLLTDCGGVAEHGGIHAIPGLETAGVVEVVKDGSRQGLAGMVGAFQNGLGRETDFRAFTGEDEYLQQGMVLDLRLPEPVVPVPFMRMSGSKGWGSRRGL